MPSVSGDLSAVGALVVLWILALAGIAWVGFTMNPPAIGFGWWAMFIGGGIFILTAVMVAVKESLGRLFR